MTFNNEVFHKTSAEVNTQVASYFDIVDNAIAMSDTNKKYVIDAQASYSPSAPIHAGSFTTFIISPTCDNTADIYNGFIKAKLKINVDVDTQCTQDISNFQGHAFNNLWVGFKDAMDAVEKYEILANGISIYTQNFGPEESFITACGANEASKRADVYSKVRHSDIFRRKFNLARCGAYIGIPHNATSVTEVEIPLKIDLRRFLPLSNIKYLPSFAGKLELKVMFGTQGLVYCPQGPSRELIYNTSPVPIHKLDTITNEFTPIGDQIKMWTNHGDEKAALYSVSADNRTLTVRHDYQITDCYSVIPNFGIDGDIYQSLVQRYTQQELIFPTQILTFTTMSKQLGTGHGSSTQTITPRFVDSIFFLFPLKSSHHTVFKNPNFTNFQLRCGGYGVVPTIPFATDGSDPMFIELCQNAMNVNGEQTGFNKEVINSLTNDQKWDATDGLFSNDRTSFFIGLPTETDNTFQQGQTSNTPITYEIVCDLPTGGDKSYYAANNKTPPIMALLQDTVISIHVQPNGMPPVVEIGAYDITSR